MDKQVLVRDLIARLRTMDQNAPVDISYEAGCCQESSFDVFVKDGRVILDADGDWDSLGHIRHCSWCSTPGSPDPKHHPKGQSEHIIPLNK